MRRPLAVASAAALTLLAACSTSEPDLDDGEGTATSVASEAEPGVPTLTLELVTDEIAAPREVLALEDGSMLVSDQNGLVRVLEGEALRPDPFLDLTADLMGPNSRELELGLAGLALAPDFATSGIFYTVTTREPGPDVDGRRVDTLTAWRADPGTLVADPTSAVVLVEVPQDGGNHVGDLAVDADGVLWMGVGSPGPSSPAQDPTSPIGSLLRIVPDGAGGYAAPEIFSYGYRNPWRMSVDPDLGLLLAEAMSSDAYQHVWTPAAGDDAGYPVVGRASKNCWDGDERVDACTELDGVAIAAPQLEYGPEIGTIVSGAVGLGASYGDLDGQVLVSDWNGSLLLATPDGEPWQHVEVEQTTELPGQRYLWDLAVGADRIVYASTTNPSLDEGELWRVVLAG